MKQKFRHIAIFFALLIRILSNAYPSNLVHDDSKTSIEKSAVGIESIKAWEFVIEGAAIRVKTAVLEKISIALNRGIKEVSDVMSHANHPNILTYTVEHIFRGLELMVEDIISALITDNSRKLTDRLKETGDGFYDAVFKNAGGVNVLNDLTNTPTWSDQQIWDQINKPWIDAAIGRGDVIRAVSDPTLPANLFKDGISGDLTFFGREHFHLTQVNGYTYNALTFTYTK